MESLEELRENAASRRAFIQRMTVAGLGTAAIALLDCPRAFAGEIMRVAKPAAKVTKAATAKPEAAGTTAGPNPFTALGIPGRNVNEQIANYALTLEFLEADLYRQALNVASGLPITTALSTNPNSYALSVGAGTLSGARAAQGFTALLAFTYVETAHRDFLRAVIKSGGGTPVTANPGGYAFPGGPGGDLSTILGNILPLEETGVRAYLGALPFYTDFGAAQVAGTIYSTEARHSADLAYILGIDPGPSKRGGDRMVIAAYPHNNTLEYFLQPATVVSRASAYFA